MQSAKRTLVFRMLSAFVLASFLATSVLPSQAYAQALNLPAPGTMVMTSPAFIPVIMKGLQIHPDNPLLFDFILDTGKSGLKVDSAEFKTESQKLIKYFLASLTIKEDDLWVNLSPYEKDRMIPTGLGKTELGRDMLAQDYILKQLTASLIYPEKELGKAFWDRVYTKAREQFGTADIPVDTFNKVWIMADKAKVLEGNGAAYVVGAHLKVMLESDYLAESKTLAVSGQPSDGEGVSAEKTAARELAKQLIREVVLPEIEKEVNQGQNFATLRQMFYSMILATWYQVALKDALLNQVYSNRGKTSGVLSDDPAVGEKIYQQYLAAYKKGVFNYIKEDLDAVSQQPLPRKYFSGGLEKKLRIPAVLERRPASSATPAERDDVQAGDLAMASVQINGKSDAAMAGASEREKFAAAMPGLRTLQIKASGALMNQGVSDSPRLKEADRLLKELEAVAHMSRPRAGTQLSDGELRDAMEKLSQAEQIYKEIIDPSTGAGAGSAGRVAGMVQSALPRLAFISGRVQKSLDRLVAERGKVQQRLFDIDRMMEHHEKERTVPIGQERTYAELAPEKARAKLELAKFDAQIERRKKLLQGLSSDQARQSDAAMAAGDAKRALGDLARRALLFVVLGGSSSCAVPSKTPEPASLEALQPVSGDTPEQLSNKLDKLKIELNGAQSAYDKILKDEQDNQRMIDQKMELKRASARSLEISRNKTASEAQLQQIQLQIRSIEKLLESSGGEKGLGQKTEGQGSDKAMNGGIDLNAKNMGLDVAKDGKGIEMKFDPAMVAEFQKGNFAGVEGIILRIVPIQSPLPILGLETSRTEGALAKG